MAQMSQLSPFTMVNMEWEYYREQGLDFNQVWTEALGAEEPMRCATHNYFERCNNRGGARVSIGALGMEESELDVFAERLSKCIALFRKQAGVAAEPNRRPGQS